MEHLESHSHSVDLNRVWRAGLWAALSTFLLGAAWAASSHGISVSWKRLVLGAVITGLGFVSLHFHRRREGESGAPFLYLGHALLLVAMFLGLREVGFLDRLAATMDEQAYQRPVLLVEALGRLRAWDLLLLLPVLVPPFVAFRKLKWKELTPGICFWPIGASVLALAFAFSAYHYNYYYDQWHYFDRILVVVLGLAALWHPAFVAPFALQVVLVLVQFDHPLVNRFSMTDKRVLFDLFLLWPAFLVMRLADRRTDARLFLVIGYCMVASHYFHSGLAKILIGWMWENDISNIFVAAYNNGWLAFLGEPAILRIQGVLSALNWAGLAFTIIAEVGFLVGFWHRRWAITLLAAAILLHIWIFVASGILFWMWILVDLAFIRVFLKFDTRLQATSVARHIPFAFSLVLILLSLVLWDPKILAWYDSPYHALYRVDGVGRSGRVYEIPPASFAPYDVPFAQGRFQYLDDIPILSMTYGAVPDLARYNDLRSIRSPDEIRVRLRSGNGRKKSEKDIRSFEDFIAKWFNHVNRRGSGYEPASLFFPPQHIWTGSVDGVPFDWSEPIVSVSIRQQGILFDGKKRHTVVDTVVNQTEVPQ